MRHRSSQCLTPLPGFVVGVLAFLTLALSGHSTEKVVPKLAAEPILSWNTFLGGTMRDEALAIASDSAGAVYVVGRSNTSWGDPRRKHAGGPWDGFVARLDSSGQLVWNTFLGSAGDDVAVGVVVRGGRIYVSGASAGNWGSPVAGPRSDYDAFVACLSSEGDLLWNTFLGSDGLDGAAGIAADGEGHVFVTGGSSASWGTPLRAHAGQADAFVAALSEDGRLLWNTFLGSPVEDIATGLAIGANRALLVTGTSKGSWGNPVRPYSRDDDAFVACLAAGNGELSWNTFLGSNAVDQAGGISVPPDGGGAVVVGVSWTSWGAPVSAFKGSSDVFCAQVDASGKLVWNTFLGAADEVRWTTIPATVFEGVDEALGVVTSDTGRVFVAGRSRLSWGAPSNPHSGSRFDVFIAALTPDGATRWNTFLGAQSSPPAETVAAVGLASDGGGGLYVSGRAGRLNRPIRGNSGGLDAFVAKLYDPYTDGSVILTLDPATCVIPGGSDRCSVRYQVNNPNQKALQVWVKGPHDVNEVPVTGTESNLKFEGMFDWVFQGTVNFFVYETVDGARRLRCANSASGIRGASAARLSFARNSCAISGNGNRCSVSYEVSNPNRSSLQLWAQSPNDKMPVAVSGVLTEEVFGGTFDWVTEGVTTFYLYDVADGVSELVLSSTVMGLRPALTAVPSSCTVPSGADCCSTTVQGINPDGVQAQLWVKGARDAAERPFTGTFTDTNFAFVFSYVFPGRTDFSMYEVGGFTKNLLAKTSVTAEGARGVVSITFFPSTVYRAGDRFYHYRVSLRELNGVGVKLTSLNISGQNYTDHIVSWFGSSYLPARGELAVDLVTKEATEPTEKVWTLEGNDDNGHNGVWSKSVSFR